MGSDKVPRPAYVVDVDEGSGKRVPGSRRSAKTSSTKPKVSQHESSRSDKPKRRDAEAQHAERAVVSGARKQEVVTTEKKERRKSSSSSTHSPRKENRPPSAHKNQSFKLPLPNIHIPGRHSKGEDPAHFGQPTPTSATRPAPLSQPTMSQPIPMRPRAVTAQTYPPRPVSYHATYTSTGQYGPPLSHSAWANYQPPPQPVITPAYSPSPYAVQFAPARVVQPAPDYFGSQAMSAPERPMSARPLSSRFNPPARTSSGFGYHDTHQQEIEDAYSAGYYEDGYASASEGVARKEGRSIRVPSKVGQRLSKAEADYQAMPPPPPRPILRRPVTEYSVESSAPYHREGRTLIRDDSRPRHSSSHRNSVSYDLGDGPEPVRIETANTTRRRQSYYGQTASASTESSGYEDKVRQATTYQQDVGETAPLTAELLKRQQRRQAGSSRSTKSSASRDESDWRKSATTRTTRSGSGENENVTIKVTGTARVMVGGAQIDCADGGAIEIKQQQPEERKAIRNGSERSSEYGGRSHRIDDVRSRDERRSRDDRTSGRSRMSSRHSYTRSRPQQYYSDSRDSREQTWI